jgi:hypothetical protein
MFDQRGEEMINKKGLAVSQCLLMILGMVGFAFIVGVGSVSGEEERYNKGDVFTIGRDTYEVLNEGGLIKTSFNTGSISSMISGKWIRKVDNPTKPAVAGTPVSLPLMGVRSFNQNYVSAAKVSLNLDTTGDGVNVGQSGISNGNYLATVKSFDKEKDLYIVNIQEANSNFDITVPASQIEGSLVEVKQGDNTYLRQGTGENLASFFTRADDGKLTSATLSTEGLTPEQKASLYGTTYTAPSVPKSDQYAFEKYQIPGTKYGQAGHLMQGLAWGVALYGFVKVLGGIVSDDPEVVDAIAEAGFYGVLAFQGMQQVFGEGGWTKAQGKGFWGSEYTHATIGALVAWWVYTSQYEKTKEFTEQVSFQCLSWQAPKGGNDCELCNHDEIPCSEYRCKSLGQTCEIVNKGTEFELCVDESVDDPNPPIITPWKEALSEGFEYREVNPSPPGPGFAIRRAVGLDHCIPAFTPLEFGIQTDKPSQCKIDVEYKDSYEEMAAYFGGDNVFKYEHSEFLSLPKAKDIKNSSINLAMGDEMTLYVRCVDSQGNLNQAPYAVRFCVDSAPDTTAPQIKATSIETGSCVAADRNSTQVSFYTDEPAQCKWGFADQAYDSLPYEMACTTQSYQVNSLMLYTCTTELTSVSRTGTDYYIRCEDQQNALKEDRNAMQESFNFHLRGSNPLRLKTILPNGTIYGGVSPMRVELRAETLFGCNNNRAVCFYSPTGQENSYVSFFDTDKSDGVHKQMLDLYGGTHTYYVKCVDAGGNVAESNTTFNLDIDTTSPIVARAYYEDNYLKIVTVRDSECRYTTENCDFLFEEGQSMPYANSPIKVVAWDDTKTYYIKCRDEFRNEPIDCSAIIRPKWNFLYY